MRTSSRPALHLTDRGTGEPVLLITGWTISSAVFDPVAHLYTPHLRVVAYDHRGTGRSAPWLGPVSIASLAADAARVLDDRGIAAAHVIGLSMGALVALELAVRMPARVSSLVLVGGGVGGPATVLPGPRRAIAAGAAVARDSVRHRRLWPAAALFSDTFRASQPDAVHELTAPFGAHRPPPWAVGWQTLAVSCFGRAGALPRVTAPTLVLHGGADVMSPVGNARRLAAAIPGAQLHVVPGAGHAVPLEHPQASAELIVDWVGRHAGRRLASPSWAAVAGERLSRPLALHLGAARNTWDTARAAARGR